MVLIPRPSFPRSPPLPRIHRPPTPCRSRHHRLRRNPGGNDFPRRPLPNRARKHRATHHSDDGHKSIGRKRPQETALCAGEDPELQLRRIKATGPDQNPFVGRPGIRTHCRNHRESLTAASEVPLHKWFGRRNDLKGHGFSRTALGHSRRGFSR